MEYYNPEASDYFSEVQTHPIELIKNKINVIIRLHSEKGVSQLSHCLLSLFGQDFEYTQPIIVLQGFTEKKLENIIYEVEKWPWEMKHKDSTPKIINCPNPESKDLRSKLFNTGFEAADGQYLAILDYDDVIYGDAYSYLIDRLIKNKENAVAFGNIVRTDISPFGGFYYQEKKVHPFHGNDKYDLFVENFCPIHSFVIDRYRAPKEVMYFDESMSKNEDYHFLVRLLAVCEGDFEARSKFVGEYYVRTDGSNTIDSEYSDPSENKKKDWELARLQMERLYENTKTSIPISNIRFFKNKLHTASSIDSIVQHSHEQLLTTERKLAESNTLISEINFVNKIYTLNSIRDYRINNKGNYNSVKLHLDEIYEDEDDIKISGWCIDEDLRTHPNLAYIYIDGALETCRFLIERPDVANFFDIKKLRGFNFLMEKKKTLPSGGLAGSYFCAVFSDGKVVVKDLNL